MTTLFPSSLDSLTNPTSGNPMNSPSHADQHANANDAIEALEAKVGVDGSAVATSLDYLVKNASSSDPGHQHSISAVTGLQAAIDGKADSSHNHDASDIDAGTLALARGGTGSGTASGARTNLGAQAKISVTVGSSDADYITDGTADNVQIQAAIDAVNAAGGGTVRLKGETYDVAAAIQLKANVNLVGEGWSTILRSANSSNIYPLQATFANGVTNILLKDFKVDMNGTNQTSNGWVALTAITHYTIDHVWFYNSRTFGMLIQANGDPLTGDLPKYGLVQNCRFDTQSTSNDFAVFNTRYTRIVNNYFGTCATGSNYALSSGRTMRHCVIANNIFEDTANTSIGLEDIQDVIVSGNRISGAGQNGIYCKVVSLTDVQRVVIDGNICTGCGNDGISVEKPLECIVTNNICYNNDRDGISSNTCYNTTIANNTCYNNNQDSNTTPVGSGIRLSGGTPQHVLIHGNQCFDNQGSQTQNYGIYSGNGDYIFVQSNRVSGNVTGQISITGSNSKIRQNDGFVTENSGTGTINSGATSAVITHGLSVTPTAKHIQVTFTENPTNDPGNIWISSITSTQFTVNTRNDPGASNLDFSWQAIVL